MREDRVLEQVKRGIVALLPAIVLMAGCRGSAEPEGPPAPAARPSTSATDPSPSAAASVELPGDGRGESIEPSGEFSPPTSPAVPDAGEPPEEEASEPWPQPQQVRSLADLFDVPDSAATWMPKVPRLEVDEARVAAAGIRKLTGKHLVLYTDLPPGEEIDVLPEVFDQAFPQWCAYFGVDPREHADWQMTGFLMKERPPFEEAGVLPRSLPPFPNGYARNYELWLYDQPSDYYRRHLLLHEGTHGFMNSLLGGCGPPWYMEGMAELMGTHRWGDGRLTMGYMPATREEVPLWGRIKIVKDLFDEHQAKRLIDVIHYSRRAHRENEPYAWSWAAAALLDGHPRYQARFRELPKLVLRPDFSDRFLRLLGDDRDGLAEEWQVFVADLEYGYDVAKTAVDFTPGKPLEEGGTTVTVAADRGWQNSGLKLQAGVPYRLRAQGRYQVADRPQIWWCEPNGVSIRYYRGRPLGILLGAVHADGPGEGGPSPLIRPGTISLGTTLTPERTGTLFLRINDSGAELGDNAGTLTVEISPQSAARKTD